MKYKIYDGYYNPTDGKFYGDKWYSKTRLVHPENECCYRDLLTNKIFFWNNQKYVDHSFFQTFDYNEFKNTSFIQTNQVYLAAPGHRILGVLNGIDEESAQLTTKLNNTYELSFTINRYVDGYVTSYYNIIARHYELFIPHFGWFKITDEPEIEGDGTTETKSIVAESGEIELQQYDLVDFQVNTGAVESRELLATDNAYELDGYYVAHDSVRFYWDTSDLEKAIIEFQETDGSVAALKEFVKTHRFLIYRQSETNPGLNVGCWRITANAGTMGIDIDASHTLTEQEKKDGVTYPDYTGTEILNMELQRERELSLLWLVLHEHGWKVGHVDPYIDTTSDDKTDRIKLAERSGSFEIDSQNIYAFLTQDVAPLFRCVFVFDTENYFVNAYSITNIGFNTDIVLSFRNVQNQISRTTDQELYTVFRVQGDDGLDFSEVNFGSNTIEDISYFLNTNHFSQEFIDKYNHWLEVREAKRSQYAIKSLQYRNQNDVVNELLDRVPLDNANGNQYNSMTKDELIAEREMMIALKKGFEKYYVDDEGNFDIDAIRESSDWPNYSALVNITLSSPLDALDGIKFLQHEDSDSYEYILDKDTYNNLHPDTPVASSDDLRLGNIDVAILNQNIINGTYQDQSLSPIEQLKRINVSTQWKYLDNFQYDFDTYGFMYGVNELQTISKSLFNNISTLNATGYLASNFTPVTVAEFDPQQTYYVRVQDEDVNYIYAETTDTAPQSGVQYYIYSEYLDIYNLDVYNEYIKYTNGYASCLRALEERTSQYNTEKSKLDIIIDEMNQLKNDVLMTNPEFGFTEEELELLDKYRIYTDYTNENILVTNNSTNEEIIETQNDLYMDAANRLYVESHPQYTWATTQDNLLLIPEFQQWHGSLHVGNYIRVAVRDDYYVKLRISQISLNPFLIDPTINIQFTNMLQYKSKRNDFIDLISQSNSSTKNSIQTIQKTVGNDNTVNIDSALILKLINSPTFAKYQGALTANQNIAANQIAADVINSSYINVGKIVGTSAEFEELWADNLGANTIATKLLDADQAHIEDLSAEIIRVGEDGITEITEDTIRTANISADQITSGTINADRIDSDTIVTKLIEAESADLENVFADKIDSDLVVTKLVEADSADLNTLVANTAFVQKIQGESATWLTNTVNDQYVYRAVANKISVADLKAHNATANVLTLISADGETPAIAFKNSTQQFYDADGNVRVQIGQDGNGNFTFTIVGDDGSTALFDSHGITADGIPDNTILTDMIKDGEVTKEKVSFPVANANNDGTISIAEIKDGSGGDFGVSYATFKQNTEGSINDLDTAIDTVSLNVDSLNNQISTKVSQTDFNNAISSVESSITQTADKLDLVVSASEDQQTHETSLTLTPEMLTAMTDQFVVKSPDGTRTVISGGKMSTDAIQSNNYVAPTSTTAPFSSNGSSFDLANGNIRTKGFYSGSDGSARIGNANYYVNLDGTTGQISANVSSLSIGGTAAATQTQASNAAKTATNYLYYSNAKGLVVHDGSEDVESDSDVNGLQKGNVRITSQGMDIYNGNNKIAQYGSEVIIGPQILSQDSPSSVKINLNGMQYNNGGDEAFYVGVEQRVTEISEEEDENETAPSDDDIIDRQIYDYIRICELEKKTLDNGGYMNYESATDQWTVDKSLKVFQRSTKDPKCDVLLDYYIDDNYIVWALPQNENEIKLDLFPREIKTIDGITYYETYEICVPNSVNKNNIIAKNGYLYGLYEADRGDNYTIYIGYTSIFKDKIINSITGEEYEFVIFSAQSETTVVNEEDFIDEVHAIGGAKYYKIYVVPENVIVKSVIRTSDGSLLLPDEEWYLDENRGLWVRDDYHVKYTIAYVGDTESPYFVFGPNTYSSGEPAGKYSFAAGDHCSAKGSNQAVFGRYNKRSSSPAFIIGNGTEEVRSNCFTIDWYGNVMANGQLFSSDELTSEDIDKCFI